MNIWKDGWLPLTYFPNWFKNIKIFFRRIKWSYQRIIRGYADIDVWNMGSHLAELIPNMLDSLVDNGYSYPYNYSPESWSEYIHKAASYIRCYLNEDEDCLDAMAKMERFKENKKTFKEGMRLIVDEWDNLWD